MKARKIGTWEIHLRSEKDWKRMERGWRLFSFAFFRWRKLPDEGARLQKQHIHGVFIQFYYFLPFEAA